MMKRTLPLAFALAGLGLALAPAANAALSVTMSVVGTPTPGSIITLETRGTADGGETDISVFGPVLYQSASVNSKFQNAALVLTQNIMPGWLSAALACTSLRCGVFQQIAGSPQPGQSNFLLSQSEFEIKGTTLPGTVITFTWQTTPTTQDLDWFTLTGANACAPGGGCAAPGVSITVIPEPTTAALFGLGVVGLTVAGRRRA